MTKIQIKYTRAHARGILIRLVHAFGVSTILLHPADSAGFRYLGITKLFFEFRNLNLEFVWNLEFKV